MNYRDTLHAIDTAKALELLGIKSENKGAYLTFHCPNGCESPALFKTYGDRKNLWYCPKCKKGGNLIKLTMEKKNLEWQPAKELLSKAITQSAKPIAQEMTLSAARAMAFRTALTLTDLFGGGYRRHHDEGRPQRSLPVWQRE